MKAAMIINPNAGKKKGLKVAEETTKLLAAEGVEVESFVSNVKGQTLTLAEELDLDSYNAVIAVGGDGTLFEVINGLFKSRTHIPVPLAQIPVGTGNSFLKDLNIHSPEQAVEAILKGRTGAVDLGSFVSEGRSWYFINLLGAGFVSNVAYRAQRYKAFGALSYIFGVLEEVAVMKAVPVELTVDGEKLKRDVLFTEICNSRYTGGDMMMGPGAKIDDGLLDLVFMRKSTRRKLLSLFPSIFKGRHVEDDLIEVFRAKEITVESAVPMALTPDGETFGTTPISVKVHPAKIRMFF